MKLPEIRFKGFEGEWDKIKLSDITISIKSGKDTPANGTVPLYGSTGIIGTVNSASYDIPLLLVARVGANAGHLQLVDEKCGVTDNTLVVSSKTKTSLDYLFFFFQHYKLNDLVYGSGQPLITGGMLKELDVYMGNGSEREAIISYFKYLDSLIQTTTKKIASLKQMKSACLVSMFPQEGETKPRVRFKGFEGEWEKVIFGSLIRECMDRSTVENEDILLSSSIEGVFLNSELFGHQRGRSNIGYRKIRKNMMILSAQNLHLGNANVNLRFGHGLVSPAYKIYDLIGCSPLFMHCWIKRGETKKFFLDATTEGASLCRKNIVWNDLYNQYIFIPSVEEQDKIGSFFSTLDAQISLQEQRLEKLKQIKSACLDKMFV